MKTQNMGHYVKALLRLHRFKDWFESFLFAAMLSDSVNELKFNGSPGSSVG